jgi:ParB-like chromosome segregation protein Spo0J
MFDMNALEIEYVPVSELVPYANNAKLHDREQIEQIKKSIEDYGFNDPVAVWHNSGGDMEIVEGHGRVIALKELGASECPVIYLDRLTDEQRREYTLVHNKLTMNTGYDFDMLMEELDSLNDFDAEFFGFEGAIDDEVEDDTYTRKVDSPIYEITGENPKVEDLCDTTRADELKADIESADIPEDVRKFLEYAAMRHVVFNYASIAEFYAHADRDVQRLMEDSALVIIDYDRAIELGYVRLRDSMEAMLDEE